MTHDWIKDDVAVQMSDVSEGKEIFQHDLERAQYKSVITTPLDKVISMTAPNDICTLLSRSLQVGQKSLLVSSYFERASGRLTECKLNKISTAFFSGLTDNNKLSPSLLCIEAQKQEFAHRLDYGKDDYNSPADDFAWQDVVHTEISELLTACHSACHVIRRELPDCDVPQIPL